MTTNSIVEPRSGGIQRLVLRIIFCSMRELIMQAYDPKEVAKHFNDHLNRLRVVFSRESKLPPSEANVKNLNPRCTNILDQLIKLIR
jgi:hypothetical protein